MELYVQSTISWTRDYDFDAICNMRNKLTPAQFEKSLKISTNIPEQLSNLLIAAPVDLNPKQFYENAIISLKKFGSDLKNILAISIKAVIAAQKCEKLQEFLNSNILETLIQDGNEELVIAKLYLAYLSNSPLKVEYNNSIQNPYKCLFFYISSLNRLMLNDIENASEGFFNCLLFSGYCPEIRPAAVAGYSVASFLLGLEESEFRRTVKPKYALKGFADDIWRTNIALPDLHEFQYLHEQLLDEKKNRKLILLSKTVSCIKKEDVPDFDHLHDLAKHNRLCFEEKDNVVNFTRPSIDVTIHKELENLGVSQI